MAVIISKLDKVLHELVVPLKLQQIHALFLYHPLRPFVFLVGTAFQGSSGQGCFG